MRTTSFAAAVFLTLLFVPACGASTRVAREPTPGKPTLSVMSYNVNFGIPCDPPTLDVISRSNVDAIFLQETTPAWEGCLRDALAPSHPHIVFRHGLGAGGLAILSRTAFDDAAYMPSPVGWFAAWRVVLHSALGDVQVLSVHLRPQVSDSGSYVSGYLSTGHYRKAEIEAYAPTLDKALPALALGDFNEEDGDALAHLKEAGMRDVLEDFELGTTWRWPTPLPTPLGELTMQLDHVFYRGKLTPLSAKVVEAGRSDHLPVVVVFEAE